MNECEALSEAKQRQVRAELDHLVASATFRTSKRCREFLTYIVEHTLNGPPVNLKERSIGVDLFDLPHDFDTAQHTIVRVTATEVRKKLAQHYLSQNGSQHPVRIHLPPGSYSADFKWAAAPPELPVVIPPPEPPSSLPTRPSMRRYWIALAILASIIGGSVIAYVRSRSHLRSASATSKAAPIAEPAARATMDGGAIRLLAGSNESYFDRCGRKWGPDQFFSGGSVIYRPAEKISRSLDPDIYRHLRSGDFRYDIPLSPDAYELHLHFAETGLADSISAESSGEGLRLFRVVANDKTLLNYFDIVADAAGSNTSDVRVFRDISPGGDGILHLVFTSLRGTAVVSGIELIPVSPGRVKPVRIRAGWPTSWQDSSGQQWEADRYFQGGNSLVRSTNPATQSDSSRPDTGLYGSERWGHFSYAVPVADGRYRITLKFVEGHYGRHNTGVGGVGSRLFDVYCNGVALLKNFDIVDAAGGEGRPIDRTFTGVQPTAQGKINLTFVPVKGMPCVNGIEIAEDFT